MKGYMATLGLVLLAMPTLLAADRLTDRDVKALVERIDQVRDRFEDSLDGELKRSTVRNANGEMNVEQFLDDFQNNIDLLKERITDENPASREVEIVLNQASAIDGFLQRHPSETKGRSEWNQLVGDFRTLAGAYGTSFPIAPTAKANRINDREIASTAEAIKEAAERLEDSLDDELQKVATVSASARGGAVDEVKQLARDADALRGRVNDSQPSTAEAERMLQRAGKINGFLRANPAPQSNTAFAAILPRLQTVATAYQMVLP
jgi:hypothetical protein